MARSANGRPSRVAIYLRVSKDDGSQDPENQLLQLREFCERQGHEPVAEYVDRESGRKGKRERAEFSRMFEDAARRRFDLVLFWSLDRFSREGIRKTIGYLQHLEALGVTFKSFTEPFMDTENELIRHIVLGVTSYYAELEAIRISDRTKAGLARARASGKVIGRPDGFERWRETLAAMREDGYGKKRMSRETRLSYNTVVKYLERMDAEISGGDPDAVEAVLARRAAGKTYCAPHDPADGTRSGTREAAREARP